MISGYIDRIEGEYAVIYLGEEMMQINFPQKFLPENLKEGDYIQINIAFDRDATECAAQEVKDLMS